MKLLLALMLVSGFCLAQTHKVKKSDYEQLSWLEGTWNRTNVRADRTAHERWVKVGVEILQGWGVTMKGSDTTFVEKLKIVSKDNELYYVADVPGNKELTYFKFTSLTDNGFVCENPEHDFPKKIAYQLDGMKLKATISGNGKSVDYFFEKLSQR